jgi:SSS family solute:Na+ symporter
MIGIGAWFARRHKTTEDYFLAGRKMPWLIVGMSMYASLTSAITFMALPATAYKENISFLVVSLISPLVAPFLILLFYPFYHRLRVVTSYEYIDHRFGRPARFAVSGPLYPGPPRLAGHRDLRPRPRPLHGDQHPAQPCAS